MKYFSPEHRKNISLSLKGRKMSPEWKTKLSLAKVGKKMEKTMAEKHWNWKSEKEIGSSGIHKWVRSRKPKPKYCESCGKEKWLELSCRDHNYTRDVKNYQYLCRSCHRKWDIQHNRLENHKKAARQHHLNCVKTESKMCD